MVVAQEMAPVSRLARRPRIDRTTPSDPRMHLWRSGFKMQLAPANSDDGGARCRLDRWLGLLTQTRD